MMEWEKMQIVVQNEKSYLSNEKIINVIRGPAFSMCPEADMYRYICERTYTGYDYVHG